MKPARYELTSLGELAKREGINHAKLVKAVEQLGLVPALRLNGLAMFDGEQLAAIVRAARQQQLNPGARP